MSSSARILDANANRAREALRVMEDAARFALNDANLSEQLKSMRHELRSILASMVPAGLLEANRDTPGDVGTAITTTSEMHRGDLLEVVIAAGKRLTESLRVIEEISKIEVQKSDVSNRRSATAPSRIEALRYRAYELDARLQLRFGSGRATQWKLCVVLTRSLCKRPWHEVLCEAVQGGADCVQVREKDMHAAEVVKHVCEVMAIAKPRATVIVNDRVDIALAAGADGVHLGQDDLAVHDVRQLAGRSLIVGVSAHDLDEAQAAVDAGADYCGVGTMFTSVTKPGCAPTGPAFLKTFIERFPDTPHLAIGGITPANIQKLADVDVRGVAISSAICAAASPGSIARSILETMHCDAI